MPLGGIPSSSMPRSVAPLILRLLDAARLFGGLAPQLRRFARGRRSNPWSTSAAVVGRRHVRDASAGAARAIDAARRAGTECLAGRCRCGSSRPDAKDALQRCTGTRRNMRTRSAPPSPPAMSFRRRLPLRPMKCIVRRSDAGEEPAMFHVKRLLRRVTWVAMSTVCKRRVTQRPACRRAHWDCGASLIDLGEVWHPQRHLTSPKADVPRRRPQRPARQPTSADPRAMVIQCLFHEIGGVVRRL